MEKTNYTVGYLDEEEDWQIIIRNRLKNDFKILILDLPSNPEQIWDTVLKEKIDALIVDFCLFESGSVSYTGNDIINAIQQHNMHFPLFILTSYEHNAFSKCEDVLIIRDKGIFQNEESIKQFKLTLKGRLDAYYKKKDSFRQRLLELNKKNTLNQQDKEEKFKIELYLSELDLDHSPALNLLPSGLEEYLESILKLTKEISSSYNNHNHEVS